MMGCCAPPKAWPVWKADCSPACRPGRCHREWASHHIVETTWIGTRSRARLAEAGLLEDNPDRLRATPAGRQRLNAVLAAILN